jgi:IS30 family transposase
MKYHHLSFEERFVIEMLYQAGSSVRSVAKLLSRSVNTVAREIRRNSVNSVYDAKKAEHKSYATRWRAKQQCLKVALSAFLTITVEEKLEKKWSPKQISGYLKRELGVLCSAKAIYNC